MWKVFAPKPENSTCCLNQQLRSFAPSSSTYRHPSPRCCRSQAVFSSLPLPLCPRPSLDVPLRKYPDNEVHSSSRQSDPLLCAACFWVPRHRRAHPSESVGAAKTLSTERLYTASIPSEGYITVLPTICFLGPKMGAKAVATCLRNGRRQLAEGRLTGGSLQSGARGASCMFSTPKGNR